MKYVLTFLFTSLSIGFSFGHKTNSFLWLIEKLNKSGRIRTPHGRNEWVQAEPRIFVFQLFHMNIRKPLWFIYCKKKRKKAAIICIWKIEKLEKVCEGYCTRMNRLKYLVFAAQNRRCLRTISSFSFIFFVIKLLKHLPQQKQVFWLSSQFRSLFGWYAGQAGRTTEKMHAGWGD